MPQTDQAPGLPVQARIDARLDAPDLISQRKIASDLQAEALGLVPYVPNKQYFYRTACRRHITGIISGQFVFWDVQRV